MNNTDIKDFRSELYSKYFSTFTKFIGEEDLFDKKTKNVLFTIYKKWYLPIIKRFPKNVAVLDIGCGTGHMLNFLKKEGFQNLYGIDISEELIKLTREKGINADVYDIFNFLGINKKKFDVVFGLDIIEHFYKDELFGLFKGLNNILNDNGIIIIHTPNGDGLFPQHIIYGDLTHLTIFNSNSLSQILRSTGFTKIRCSETGPTSKNFKGIIRIILWKIIRLVFQSIRIVETGGSEKILTQDFICIAHKSNENDN